MAGQVCQHEAGHREGRVRRGAPALPGVPGLEYYFGLLFLWPPQKTINIFLKYIIF